MYSLISPLLRVIQVCIATLVAMCRISRIFRIFRIIAENAKTFIASAGLSVPTPVPSEGSLAATVTSKPPQASLTLP